MKKIIPGTILFKHDENTYYSPEELISQLLYRAKEFAEQSAHQSIKECVLTVPGYFNQIERKALLQAAQLANLKVLQLINDHMAVALNYGIFRTKDFNETAQYVMFYDMGASSTTATIVSLQNIKTKERGYVETHPQISVIGVGYDRTLGGLEIQIRLRDYLGKKFNEMKKTKQDVFKNPRAMAKLFKEAGRLKNVLSANAEHYAQIEGLIDEQDFKMLVTREDLENLCTDVFERVGGPIERALKAASLTIDVINQIVLVGAGTRVPKVQEKLQQIVGKELAKNLNTDEAAAMGAVYKAADLSTGFQVKKFITKDAVIFPIQVVFERETEGNIKQVKRTLFGYMNPYPQKKIITFNKHTQDFLFNVNYAELDNIPKEEILNIGMLNLTQISLQGVTDAIQRNTGENIESKGIKAHFAMDESGILNLVNVEYVVEKTVVSEEEEEEGTLSKIGSTFSKLFSGQIDEKPVKEEPEAPKQETDNTTESSVNKTEKDSGKKNETAKDTQKEAKPKIVTLKEPLKAFEKTLTIEKLSSKQLEKSSEKIKKLTEIEKEINRRASALNNLESFVVDTQNRLYEPEYAEAATKEEIEKIQATCSEVADWLYEDGADADANTYEKKLESLKSLTKDLYLRVFEHKERPEALKALHTMLNGSRHFLESARNLTKSTNPEKDVFTDVEISTLEKVIVETEQWRDEAVKEQEKLKKYEPVKLTVKLLSEKMQGLDREVKYLVNKIKLWKPKKTEKGKDEKPVKEEKTEEEKKEVDDDNLTVESDVETNQESPDVKENNSATIKPSETTEGDQHTEL